MAIKLKDALAVLRDVCCRWKEIGRALDIRNLEAISANHCGDDERCLEEVLKDWMKNSRDSSWKKLCDALESVGLDAKAKEIKEKYSKPACSGYYILLRDLTTEKVSWSVPIVNFSKTTPAEIRKGELLIGEGDILRVLGNKNLTLKFDEEIGSNVAPLDSTLWSLFEPILKPNDRLSVFKTAGWMDWGATVKEGDKVYIRVWKNSSEECSTAIVKYVGPLNQTGTMFGVEITDSRYYGCGTSDGTYDGGRYFTCKDKNGLFLSLALVAKEPEWLKLHYYQKMDDPVITEGKQKDKNIEVKRTKDPPQPSASPKLGETNQTNTGTSELPVGTTVFVKTKDGRKIKGTIRWAGMLAHKDDPKKKKNIPSYGIEADTRVCYENFESVIAITDRPRLPFNPDRGSVFIPQTMVELDKQTNCLDKKPKQQDNNSVPDNKMPASKDIWEGHKEEEKAELSKHLGPDVDGEIDEQRKAMEKFEKAKQREHSTVPDKSTLAYKETDKQNSEAVLNSDKEALAKHLGPEIYQEIDEQRKAMERLEREKQLKDSNKDMSTNGPSYDSRNVAAEQNYPRSSSQWSRQSSNTQGPYHQPSPVVPALGNWTAELRIGSAVMISKSTPPMYGTIRWIGQIPTVTTEWVAGVELEAPMKDCTDGWCHFNGECYFTCPPNKGYYCLLSQLVPPTDHGIMRTNNNPLGYIPEEVVVDQLGVAELFDRYIGDQKGIQGHQNSCYMDATLFGLFALSGSFDELFLQGIKDKQSIEAIICKKIVNPLRSQGAARYESVMALRERLDDLGKMEGITKDEKDPEEFLNMLFKYVLHTKPFIQIRRPYGIEGEFFVQLFFESETNSNAVPKIGDMLHRMFMEQQISLTEAPQKLLIQVPRFGKQFKTYKRVIPDKILDVSKLVFETKNGNCCWCDSPAAWQCSECSSSFRDQDIAARLCDTCSGQRHRSYKYKNHKPIAFEKGDIQELELLSVICIETSHYVCFTRAGDKWLFFDSMANRIDDKYNIPRCTDCSGDINEWVYGSRLEKLLSSEPKQIPELVRRFTQDVYMCVYVTDPLYG